MQNQVPDPEQTRHVNVMYWEKMREIRNLTFWLHVVARTLVTVDLPILAQKVMEKLAKAPAAKGLENDVNANLTMFIDSFFIAFEILYAYFMFSAAACPPNIGNLEVVLIMFFNGISSGYYISMTSKRHSIIILVVWCVCALLLLMSNLAVTLEQCRNIYLEASRRIIGLWDRFQQWWNPGENP